MDYPLNDSTARLDNGRFSAGDPATAKPPSRVVASWMNLVTDSLINIITAAGLDPDDADATLVRNAINLLISNNSLTFDYIEIVNPSINVAGAAIAKSWLNEVTGELFFCIRADEDDNMWIGQLGTIVQATVIDLIPDLIHHWSGENVVGATAIDSAGSADATLTNIAISPAKVGNGFLFNASATFSTTVALINKSISFFIKRPANTTGYLNFTSDGGHYPIEIGPPANPAIQASLDNVTLISNPQVFGGKYGVFAHVVVGWVGTVYRCWVDGVLVIDQTISSSNTTGNINITSSLDDADIMDEIRIYSRMLTQSEVELLGAEQ